jgi:hypothetical protein
MKRDTGKEQNRDLSELLNSRDHARQEMAHATLSMGADFCNFNRLGWDEQIRQLEHV